jgi:RNA polymerase sigma-70 factor (ECF subfamily)
MPEAPAAPDLAPASSREEARLVAALRDGDEAAFAEVVERYSPSLLRVARLYVPSIAVAEEVVQETWLAVLAGVDRFEGRSSLKTWIFRILVNRARTRGVRESRSVPFSSLAPLVGEGDGPSVPPERFNGPDAEWPHHWNAPPRHWESPEERLLSAEARALIEKEIERLPPAQRTVITLRDVEGFDSDEVCDALGVSPGNQRVLLHRARSKVRAALERYMEGTGP